MTTTTTQSTRSQATTTDRDESDARSTAPTPGDPLREGARPPDSALSLDLVFEALKNSRRRQVVRYLENGDSTASVSELAEHVAAIENDTTVEALSSQQRKRVYVGLYQCHLPKLDDIDVVEYDDDRGTVELGPNASELTRYVDVAEGGDETDGRPWHRYYLGVSGAGVAAIALTALGLGGAVGPATVVGVGLTLALVVLAAVHAQEST